MKKIVSLLILTILFSVAGCATKPATRAETPAMYNITGEWEYTLTASDGNIYDNGTITFTGASDKGHWTQVNLYDVEYTGTYTVNGDAISLTGDETWQGYFIDGSHMSGNWQNNEASGMWTAIKR